MGIERTIPDASGISARVGAVFRLLMQLRMLIAGITLLVLPRASLSTGTVVLMLCVATLAGIAAHQWAQLLPRVIRHPSLVAAEILVSFVVLGLGGTTGPFFLATVLTGATAGLLFRWWGTLAVVGLQILAYYVVFALHPGQLLGGGFAFQALIGQPLYYPLAGFAGLALRRLLDDQARAEASRRRAEVAAAAAEERARLAREMHDSLAKTLHGIALSAAAFPKWARTDPARALAEAQQIATAIEIASREARGLLVDLRNDTVIRPLPESIRATVAQWSCATGVDAGCEVDEDIDLESRAKYEVLAILAEVLANVERHAAARTVDVRLETRGYEVALTIQDDGRGFEPVALTTLAGQGHFGLVGLQERAKRIGGRVSVHSAPDQGTKVELFMPATDRELTEVG